MTKRSAAILAVMIGLNTSCSTARVGSTVDSHGAPLQGERCAAFLMQTQAVILAILNELPRVYTAMAGVIQRIEEVGTNVYEVRIQQEERTDILTFETTISPDCRVTILRVSERVVAETSTTNVIRPPIPVPPHVRELLCHKRSTKGAHCRAWAEERTRMAIRFSQSLAEPKNANSHRLATFGPPSAQPPRQARHVINVRHELPRRLLRWP